MAEQISRRSNNVTAAPFDTPFETHTVRFGAGSLNLKDSLDAMEGWARLTNIWHENEGEATSRPGLTTLATHAGGSVNTIRKLRSPLTNAVTRFYGVGTAVHRGLSGATVVADTGYSGRPLTLLPHRAQLSEDSWMFVADAIRMRKIRADGLSLPIGLPKPAVPVNSQAHEYSTAISMFEDPAAWTPVAGSDDTDIPTNTPNAAVATAGPVAGLGIYLVTDVGGALTGYDSWWGAPVAVDLTALHEVGGGGTVIASDDDIMHIWMLMTHPQLMAEIRLYCVCSPTFDPTVLPGTRDDADTSAGPLANTDAYVKAFRANDYVQFVQATTSQVEAAEQARVYALRDADSKARGYDDKRQSWEDRRAESDPARARSFQLGLGQWQWYGLGQLGSPLRRGDFQRIGSTPNRDWSTITGIIVYVQTITLPKLEDGTQPPTPAIGIAVDDFYITGGWGPDTSTPGLQQYDYRCTNYDPRTGAESNGSDEQPANQWQDPLRRQVIVDPSPYGDAAVRQRVYRRGGSLFDDWYFCGTNAADGGPFTDGLSDSEIELAGTLPDDHFQPVPTITTGGDTILAQPVAALWGPVEGMLFACGDPHRPGHVYYSLPDEPDHWSAFGNAEVCPPSEELMHGGIVGHQAFVFSRARLYFLYPNLGGIDRGVTASPSLCTRGLIARWSFIAGPMGQVFFIAEDGIFATDGGPETWLSEAINPLFYGNAVNGYQPIDKSVVNALRLAVWENALYFQYQDTAGHVQVMVYSILQKFWRHYQFQQPHGCLQGDDEDVLLVGGTGATYLHQGTSDAGAPIVCTMRGGSFAGGRREEKLFGDIYLDVDFGNATQTMSLQVFLNEETHADTLISMGPITATGRQRLLVNAFGSSPQKAHSIACELSFQQGAGSSPTLYQLGYALTPQPDLTNQRVTNWDDLNSPDEVWLTGVTFDCDTGNVAKTVNIEIDFAGARTIIATFDVLTNGRHKVKFSWPAVSAHMVRVRPDPDCAPWLLYRADWIYVEEPPRISKWDIHFENRWDQYYTGLDLYCDTFGATKQIEVYVDEVRLVNTLAGNITYWPITTNGRRVVHLTLPWGRGHVFRFKAIDDFAGLLYTHRWHLQEEPSEQANWNQNFSILGTHADKWLKAIIFECDTFGVNKSVQVEVDGTVVQTLTVNTTGRRVVQIALTTQHLGRVWRMFPVDANPGRLYSAEPIFDEEPFQLDRWETQETNHNLPGWFYPLYGHITLKSTADVTLQTQMQFNQVGGTTTNNYVIPTTGGQKQRRFLNGFLAGKGVLIKYILTSAQPFWLYRDETVIAIQPWGSYESILVKPFGNDDQDPSRPMTHAVLAAEASGGALSTGVG